MSNSLCYGPAEPTLYIKSRQEPFDIAIVTRVDGAHTFPLLPACGTQSCEILADKIHALEREPRQDSRGRLAQVFCIETSMQFWESARRVAGLVLGVVILAGATPGSFRGTIVDNPNASKGWIYVQSRNGTARRVEISRAKVVYDEDVPAAKRLSNPAEALTPGTEVRVTAEQGSDGEWHAVRLEILKPAAGTKQSQSRTGGQRMKKGAASEG